MHHLTWPFRDDDLWFSVGFAVRVDEPATVQSQIPQNFRDGRRAMTVPSIRSSNVIREADHFRVRRIASISATSLAAVAVG
jgi:hypothetical protein